MSTYNAFQIALKTLNERCDYLQSKLDSLEEENCKLKLQIPDDSLKKAHGNADQLNMHITLLTEQKSKLNRRVQLITAENQKLWRRLSELTSNIEYKSKGDMDTISYTENHSDLEISKELIRPDRRSLEEVSLKLNSSITDKRDFPTNLDTYVERNPIAIENCAFSSSDNTAIFNSIKNHISKLKQFKQILNNNKTDLTSAISLFKNFQKNNVCSECSKNFSNHSGIQSRVCGIEEAGYDLPTVQAQELEVNDEEIYKICPLCETTLYVAYDEFCKHVSEHFSDDETDPLHTFEMVP